VADTGVIPAAGYGPRIGGSCVEEASAVGHVPPATVVTRGSAGQRVSGVGKRRLRRVARNAKG